MEMEIIRQGFAHRLKLISLIPYCIMMGRVWGWTCINVKQTHICVSIYRDFPLKILFLINLLQWNVGGIVLVN